MGSGSLKPNEHLRVRVEDNGIGGDGQAIGLRAGRDGSEQPFLRADSQMSSGSDPSSSAVLSMGPNCA